MNSTTPTETAPERGQVQGWITRVGCEGDPGTAERRLIVTLTTELGLAIRIEPTDPDALRGHTLGDLTREHGMLATATGIRHRDCHGTVKRISEAELSDVARAVEPQPWVRHNGHNPSDEAEPNPAADSPEIAELRWALGWARERRGSAERAYGDGGPQLIADGDTETIVLTADGEDDIVIDVNGANGDEVDTILTIVDRLGEAARDGRLGTRPPTTIARG